MSVITNLVIDVHGKRGAKKTTVTDFMVEWDVSEKPKEKQSVEDMKRFLVNFAKTHNESYLRTKRLHNNPPKNKKKDE